MLSNSSYSAVFLRFFIHCLAIFIHSISIKRHKGVSDMSVLYCKSPLERPAVFLRSLEDAVGEEHGKVCLQCEASKETVTPVWRKDGTVLNPTDQRELLQFGKSMALIFHCLSKDDAGQYTCDLGTSQSKARVTVHGG